jgi:N-acetylglucosaminyl-diphospho-decaprenol L-rhamnosyltransferase
MNAPDLAVLIVTYRSRADIDACLESVQRAVTNLTTEVVVIDNASGDGTVDAAERHAGVRVVALERNVGFGAAINVGLGVTTARYVLWMNPDGRLVGGNVASLLAWMDEHVEVGVVGGKVLDPDGAVQRSVRAFPSYGAAIGHRYSLLTRLFPNNPWSRRYLRGDAVLDTPQPVDWVSGALVLHRREVSDRLRGLDERFFMYVEDVDFCKRATEAGWQVWFHPGVVMEHEIGGSSRQVNRAMIVARHRSMWRYYRKHFRQFLPKDAIVWVGIWGRCAWLWMSARVRR